MKSTLLLMTLISSTVFADTIPHIDCNIKIDSNLKLQNSELRILEKKGYNLSAEASIILKSSSRREGDFIVLEGTNEMPADISGKTFSHSFSRGKKLSKDLKELPLCSILTEEYLSQECPDISGRYKMIKTTNDSGVEGISIYNRGVTMSVGQEFSITQKSCKSFEVNTYGRYPDTLVFDINLLQQIDMPTGGITILESDRNEFRVGYVRNAGKFNCGVFMGLPGCARDSKMSSFQIIRPSSDGLTLDETFSTDGKTEKSQSIFKRIQ